jgi:hypothetical protein
VSFLISTITFGIPEVLLNSCLALAFTILIPTFLLGFADKIALLVTRQPVVIDTLAKTLVTVAKSIGIILMATHIKPLCLSILDFYQLNSLYHNSDLMKYAPSQSFGRIVENGLSILLGIYLASGHRWLMKIIEKRKQGCESPHAQLNEDSVS